MTQPEDRFDYVDPANDETLVQVLDQLLDTGVVVTGDLMISVADVDLIYVGCKLVACSAEKIEVQPAIQQAFLPRIQNAS